jgi:hypothetical protein
MAIFDINWRPDRPQLRTFGLGALAAFGLLGAWVFFRHSLFGFPMDADAAHLAACLLWVAGIVCAVLALEWPAALRPLYIGLSVVGVPIGWVVSHLAMAIIFYGVLTPIGLVMRLSGRDPLHRKFDRSARSYWVDCRRRDDIRRYFRQF